MQYLYVVSSPYFYTNIVLREKKLGYAVYILI